MSKTKLRPTEHLILTLLREHCENNADKTFPEIIENLKKTFVNENKDTQKKTRYRIKIMLNELIKQI